MAERSVNFPGELIYCTPGGVPLNADALTRRNDRILELESRLDQQSRDADTLHAVIDRLEAQNAELLADSNGCRSRSDTRDKELAELAAHADYLNRKLVESDERAEKWHTAQNAAADQLDDALKALRALRDACSNTTYPNPHPIWDAWHAAERVLAVERGRRFAEVDRHVIVPCPKCGTTDSAVHDASCGPRELIG